MYGLPHLRGRRAVLLALLLVAPAVRADITFTVDPIHGSNPINYGIIIWPVGTLGDDIGNARQITSIFVGPGMDEPSQTFVVATGEKAYISWGDYVTGDSGSFASYPGGYSDNVISFDGKHFFENYFANPPALTASPAPPDLAAMAAAARPYSVNAISSLVTDCVSLFGAVAVLVIAMVGFFVFVRLAERIRR